MSVISNDLNYLELCVVVQKTPTTDHPRYYLNKSVTTELLQEIGSALTQSFPQITNCSLVGLGGIYDLPQIIRRDFPIYRELFELGKVHYRARNFKPSIVGIATDAQSFDVDCFNRDTQTNEALSIVPFIVLMPASNESTDFFNQLEETLITHTYLTAPLQTLLENALATKIEHISLATLSDVSGLLAAQLIQIGLEEFWEILKAALFSLPPQTQILGSGHRVLWEGEEVVFLTPNRSIYDEAYSEYEQNYEQYKQTLKRLKLLLTAHVIPFRECEIWESEFFKKPLDCDDALARSNNHTDLKSILLQ